MSKNKHTLQPLLNQNMVRFTPIPKSGSKLGTMAWKRTEVKKYEIFWEIYHKQIKGYPQTSIVPKYDAFPWKSVSMKFFGKSTTNKSKDTPKPLLCQNMMHFPESQSVSIFFSLKLWLLAVQLSWRVAPPLSIHFLIHLSFSHILLLLLLSPTPPHVQ